MQIRKIMEQIGGRFIGLIMLSYLAFMTFMLFGTPLLIAIFRPLPSLIGNFAVVGLLLFCINGILTFEGNTYRKSLKELVKSFRESLKLIYKGI